MNGIDLLTMQVGGSFDRLLEYTGRAEGDAWGRPAFEGANPPGFTLWHCARTLDWTFHCAILGTDELATRPEWRDRVRGDGLFGAGTTPADALEVPRQVSAADLRAYLEELRPLLMGWLAGQDADSLDVVPEFRAHQDRAGYIGAAVWAEIADLEGIPIWQLLARPAVAHVRTHLGEVDVLLQASSRSNPRESA